MFIKKGFKSKYFPNTNIQLSFGYNHKLKQKHFLIITYTRTGYLNTKIGWCVNVVHEYTYNKNYNFGC